MSAGGRRFKSGLPELRVGDGVMEAHKALALGMKVRLLLSELSDQELAGRPQPVRNGGLRKVGTP